MNDPVETEEPEPLTGRIREVKHPTEWVPAKPETTELLIQSPEK